MKRKPSKQVLKVSIALGLLAMALSACGGSKDDNKDASPSASASVSASASPSASASETPSASPSATASASVEASAPASNVAAGFKLFEDKTNGTSIQYPEDWTVQENIGGALVAFLSPTESGNDKFQENLNIVVQDLGGEEVTLEQYAEVTKQSLSQVITDLEIVSAEMASGDDGQDVYTMEYTGKQGEFELDWKQAFTIAGGKAYVLTYTAELANIDAFADVVGPMAESWTVTQ